MLEGPAHTTLPSDVIQLPSRHAVLGCRKAAQPRDVMGGARRMKGIWSPTCVGTTVLSTGMDTHTPLSPGESSSETNREDGHSDKDEEKTSDGQELRALWIRGCAQSWHGATCESICKKSRNRGHPHGRASTSRRGRHYHEAQHTVSGLLSIADQ